MKTHRMPVRRAIEVIDASGRNDGQHVASVLELLGNLDPESELEFSQADVASLINIYRIRTARRPDIEGGVSLLAALERHDSTQVLMGVVLSNGRFVGLWFNTELTRFLGFVLGLDNRS